MVTHRNMNHEIKRPIQPKKRPPFIQISLLLFVCLSLFFSYKYFEDGYVKVDGKWIIKPKFKDKIDDKVDSFDDCEVYYLLALSEGLYECLNCGDGLFYLFPNEIVKIGMTCNGQGRYHQSFYSAKNVRYQVVFLGNSRECQKEEIRRLGQYAQMPENLARPDPSKQSKKDRRYKLLYPVLNTSLK